MHIEELEQGICSQARRWCDQATKCQDCREMMGVAVDKSRIDSGNVEDDGEGTTDVTNPKHGYMINV